MHRSALSIFLKLIKLVKPLTHVMVATITLGSIGFLASIFITILGGYALLNVLGIETGITNSTIAIIVLVLVVVLSVAKYLEQLSGHFIAFKLLAVIRDKVFGSLRKLAPAKLEGRDKGNLISIITTDIELIEVFYAHTIAPISQAILCSALVIAFMGSFHYILGIIAFLGYLIVGLVIPYVNTKLGRQAGREYRTGFGELNTYLLESLRGLREILQYGQGEARRSEIADRSAKISAKNKLMKNKEGEAAAFTDLIILGFGLIILVTSIRLYQAGQMEVGAILISTITMIGSFGPVIALSALSNDLLQMLASGERVLSIIEEEPLLPEIEGELSVDYEKLGSIECNKVTFAYDKEIILDKVSLSFPNNKIIGIHGASGSGKSTLLKLLMRFWAVDRGSITFVDDKQKDINHINTSSLRNIESYVTQDTYLFHDTISDNIRIARPKATMEEIVEAATKASIHDFICSLPKGYDTPVSELGSSLSGGERQRIGLARAFLHDAPVLLLDEPTSNLDSLNEGIILKSLEKECANKSVILVSHRKSTLSIANHTYKMASGRVS